MMRAILHLGWAPRNTPLVQSTARFSNGHQSDARAKRRKSGKKKKGAPTGFDRLATTEAAPAGEGRFWGTTPGLAAGLVPSLHNFVRFVRRRPGPPPHLCSAGPQLDGRSGDQYFDRHQATATSGSLDEMVDRRHCCWSNPERRKWAAASDHLTPTSCLI